MRPKFGLRQPEVSTREVWVGFYSFMSGTVVVVYSAEPTFDEVLESYTVRDEHYLASIWIEEWEHWFGSVRPFADAGLIEWRTGIGWVSIPKLDCTKVIQIELTTCWNEHGRPIGLNVNADN